eukprot:TRINITY_DN7331_c0_g1_i1.p1 TRINITY_DN7331_c0_g1~~TRINITY_DN7331_c0_g1_i1.p1  ORF type:complete len:189 (+),score=40.26 TRINITY_DN7331_c0_g1_i1:24-590(+)
MQADSQCRSRWEAIRKSTRFFYQALTRIADGTLKGENLEKFISYHCKRSKPPSDGSMEYYTKHAKGFDERGDKDELGEYFDSFEGAKYDKRTEERRASLATSKTGLSLPSPQLDRTQTMHHHHRPSSIALDVTCDDKIDSDRITVVPGNSTPTPGERRCDEFKLKDFGLPIGLRLDISMVQHEWFMHR